MKWRFVLFSIILSSLLPAVISALPQISDSIAGDVTIFESDPATMIIGASDRAIIQYESFNVSAAEKVRFIQPSSGSTVLNRVVGENPSEILGRIESNGTVFLVNANGIYFGPESQVDVGSLVASTMDLSNVDFLNQRFAFLIEQGKEASELINRGVLKAKDEGFLALISPVVRNEGSIIAKTGKVLVAAGELVVLDFDGTGFMQFAVEGELEQAIIEQAGSIEAMQVHIGMSCVDPFIKGVINTDNITVAKTLVRQNGVIRLVSDSKITANKIEVSGFEGTHLKINGLLDTSSKEGSGGSIHLFGETLFLGEAEINASGMFGGGEILIGGNLRGEGACFTARHVRIMPQTHIVSNAGLFGDGGKVVVWADETTAFDGTISSKGGALRGNGGMVETSGFLRLSVEVGQVDTFAPQGITGNWILDPLYIEVVTDLTSTSLSNVSDCSDATSNYTSGSINGGITNSVINNATSNVVLCAQGEGGTIIVSAPVSQINPGVGITLNTNSSGSIVLNKDITTNGGVISLNGPTFIGTGLIALDTTNGGRGVGANILCSGSVDGGSSAAKLSVSAGIGEVEFRDALGKNVPLQAFTVNSGSEVLLASDLVTGSLSTGVTINPPVLLTGNVKIDTTKSGASGGASIALNGGVNGNYRLFLNAGTGGTVSLATSGEQTPLSALQTKASNIILKGDITASGSTMIFEGPVSVNANIALTDTGPTGIIFEDTVDCFGGSFTLTLDAPAGKVSFLSDVGSSVPLSNLIVSANLIRFDGDVTVTSTLTCNNPVGLLGDVTISASVVTFADTVDGSYDLTLSTGGAGTVTFGNVVGAGARLGNLTVTNVDTLSANGIYAENITQSAGTGLSTYNEFLNTTGSAGIALTSSGGFNFTGGIQTTNGGSFIVTSAGAVTATSSMDLALSNAFEQLGGGAVSWEGNIVTQGGNISFSGPLQLVGNTVLSSGSTGVGTISFASTVNGAHSLSLSSGFGDVTFGGAVGGTTPLLDIVLINAENVEAGEIQALSYTQLGGYGIGNYTGSIITTGSLGISISSNYVAFAGQNAGVILQTTNGNILINAQFGGINSLSNPVQINANGGAGTLFVGSASPAFFSGTGVAVKTLCALRPNVPCYIDYNGTEYALTTCCQSLH